MPDSPVERRLFMHAWRDKKAEWWHVHVDSEGSEVRVNFMSSDMLAIPDNRRYAHYNYVGRVVATALERVGKRDSQLDLVIQVLDHMQSRLVDEVAPWDCFVFFDSAYRHNATMQGKFWRSYAIANKVDEVVAQMARVYWDDDSDINKIRTNMLTWLALCERAGCV